MQRELTITVFGGKTLSQLDFVLCRSNFFFCSGSAIVINDTEILAIYTGINEPNVVDGGAQVRTTCKTSK